jgi:hypothetical protein
MGLNQQGRAAQAECLRALLPSAEGYGQEVADQAAQDVLDGFVEYDPEYLESLAPRRR